MSGKAAFTKSRNVRELMIHFILLFMIFPPTNNVGGRQISATIVKLIGQIRFANNVNTGGSEWIGMAPHQV